MSFVKAGGLPSKRVSIQKYNISIIRIVINNDDLERIDRVILIYHGDYAFNYEFLFI